MRKILVAIIFAGLSALADPPARQRPGNQAAGNFLPTKGPGASNACAAFGPGFAKVEGTDTCVKIGGAISVGVGSSGGVH